MVCNWDQAKTKFTKGAGRPIFPTAKKGDPCCVVLIPNGCPFTVHVEVEVIVTCSCGTVPVAGVAGTCSKVISGDFHIDCCCPEKFDSKVRRVNRVITPGKLAQDEWNANAVKVTCPKDCEKLGGGGFDNCVRTEPKCKWRVASNVMPADPQLKIIGGDDACDKVIVQSTPGNAYTICREVTFQCECRSDPTTCHYTECKVQK